VSLRLVPVSFAEATAFITDWHRHHRPPRGHKFSLGIAFGDELVGVAVVGPPVARLLDDRLTLPATPDIRTCGIPVWGKFSGYLVRRVDCPLSATDLTHQAAQSDELIASAHSVSTVVCPGAAERRLSASSDARVISVYSVARLDH
jgi:hypothetical protein